MRALITGVSGFAGSHMADLLLAHSDSEVWGTTRSGPGAASHLAGRIQLYSIDLTDASAVYTMLREVRPSRIYHLAAQAFVPASWEDPWPTLENNIRGELNLLQAMTRLDLDTRILCVSSMEVYGRTHPDDLPIDEETPLRPASPYGVSKVAQDMLAAQYWRTYGLHAVSARPFNHIGPRQNERFVAPAFARQIAEIEQGLRPPVLEVGNLDAQRDFSDVRDVVRAYRLLLESGEAGGSYNIGRGEPHSVRALLDTLLAFSDHDIAVRTDPSRLRPSDVPVSYANIGKIARATGWQPLISFRQSLQDVLEDWRLRIYAPAL